MDLKAGLWQKQTLKLSMTQELSQAIALLQYSAQELAAYLDEKAMENPLLQVEFKQVHSIDSRTGSRQKIRKVDGREHKDWIEHIGADSYTLQDHLRFQANLVKMAPGERRVLLFLIKHIDENGYLGAGIVNACAPLEVSEEEVETGIMLLQGLEPAGVGARTLQECLLLQLQRMQPDEINLAAQSIVETHFNLFVEKKWKALSKMSGLSLQKIQFIFDYVQKLNPRPGAGFQSDKTAYILPDVIIFEEDGKLTVRLPDDTVPNISFNERYHKELSAYEDREVSRYLQEKQQDFEWVLKSLEQRKETILRVALKILERQPAFIRQGRAFLKPMTMKEIADELGIHESTVSRSVRDKYIQAPAGIFEMKSLFSSALQTTEHEQTSSHHAKAALAELIGKENKQKPLSDQELAERLSERAGILLSRRTVAKYREQLGIPSSSKRKRFD